MDIFWRTVDSMDLMAAIGRLLDEYIWFSVEPVSGTKWKLIVRQHNHEKLTRAVYFP